ncbi:ROK family transcriptional regulator [Nakamurella sp. GG22]
MPSRRSTHLGASAIRQANLREHNLGLVLRLIIDAQTPVSRADIALATGLTRATVSSLADRLISARLVAELPPVMSQRAGRPAVPLVPAVKTLAAVGMEVNVDYLGLRVVDLSGAVLSRRVESADFRGSDPAKVLGRLSELYGEVTGQLPDGIRMAGSCLAVPGLVDRPHGPLRLAPNLGWRDVDVVEHFRTRPETADVRIRLDNEATLAARAEADALRPTGRLSFLYLSGEVGVGGAMVVDGAVFGGRHGWSGEIGHTVIDPNGPLCRCGSTGCLEQYAGKDALMRSAGLDLDRPIGDLQLAAEDGNPAALESLAGGARALGTAVANAINLMDVENVVLGGIYASLAPFLIPTIDDSLRSRVLSAPWSGLQVSAATIRDDAALTGAASTVLADVIDDPSAWLAR